MYLWPPKRTSAKNLNFNCYFEMERNHIILLAIQLLYVFFISLFLSFSDQNPIHRIPDQVPDITEY